MKQITVIDTSIATGNIGDEIIMDAVNNVIRELFHKYRLCRIVSHDNIGFVSLSIIRKSNYAIAGGTNLLSSKMNKDRQWKINLLDSNFIDNNIVFLGVGWREYQQGVNLYTKILLKNVLSKTIYHSVRDSYTEKKINSIGIKNVLNTGCPTIWGLDKHHCGAIPKNKSKSVVFTLTDNSRDIKNDTFLIRYLLKNYTNIYYWPQGKADYEYIQSLDIVGNIIIIPPNLYSYDKFLMENDCDYIGTRLHGGIRALQHKKRTVIIGIDNRAFEKKKDFNLPVLNRNVIEQIDELINKPIETNIHLPIEQINRWKNQFIP